MRILIDLQGAQTESRYRGIGRYSLALAKGIARNRGEHEVIIALNGLFPETIQPLRQAFSGILPPGNIRVWYAPGPVRALTSGSLWRRKAAEQLRRAFFESLRPDVVLVTSLFDGYGDDAVTGMDNPGSSLCVAGVLYDLIPYLYPETYLHPNPNFAQFYESKIALLNTLQGYLAISEASAREGRDLLGLPERAVTVISTACDDAFRPLSLKPEEARTFLASLGIPKKYILYTGGVDQRKNLHRLLGAYARLPETMRKEYVLVLAGRMPDENVDELRRHAQSQGLTEKEYLFPGYLSEEDLVKLYNLASLFVFPSLHEGFGLPALEAMNCGIPVIGSNVSSIPEVMGLQEALFDPHNEQEMASKIEQALEDEDFRRRLRQNAQERIPLFSWDATSRKALAALEELHERHKSHTSPDFLSPTSPEDLAYRIARIPQASPQEKDLLQVAWALSLNFPQPRQPRLFVDVSELYQRDAGTGVQRVTKNILKELLKNPPLGFAVHPVFATIETLGYRYASCIGETFATTATEETPLDFQRGDLFLGLDLQHHVIGRQREYLRELHRAGVVVAFVVYDLLPILLPHCFFEGTREGHEEWLRTLGNFDGVFCISRSVAQELEDWYAHNLPAPPSFTPDWFHLGGDLERGSRTEGICPEEEELLLQLAASPTFLMVGTLEPRKGHAQVLDALKILWAKGEKINLVLAGRSGWNTQALVRRIESHPRYGKNLFWFQGPSDAFLDRLYGASSALLAASEGEGFGLPLIEGARRGLPLILRDIPVFREVAGEHAYYYTGNRGEELAQALENWLALYHCKVHPLSEGLSWLTWEQSARQLGEKLVALHAKITESTL